MLEVKIDKADPADLYEQVKNPTLAIKIYERVPQSSPLRRNADIQMR